VAAIVHCRFRSLLEKAEMSGTPRRRGLIAGGAFAAAALLGGALAQAQEATVDLVDPNTALTSSEGAALDLSVGEDTDAPRFVPDAGLPEVEGPRRFQLEVAAGGADSPLDVSIAQRATLGSDQDGNIDRQGRGSELRIGRGLVNRRDDDEQRSVYMFVASDNEALTYEPGARSEFGGRGSRLSLEDRAEVGDLSAGVTIERNGVQTSLAYVEREVSTQVGNQAYSRDESFAGVTVTMRR